MKRLLLGLILLVTGCLFLQAQTVLTYQGQTYSENISGTSNGINVPRNVVTTFSFLNNSVTSINTVGYMLQAGEEGVNSNNNHLDGELIQGNKFNWNGNFAGLGTSMTITHGVFTGCNVDVNIKHNYLSRVPMGIIRKSASNMSNTTGGVSYNILKTFNVGGVVKGMSNVNWYNNTFYQDRPTYSGTDPTAGTWRGAIDVYTNTDITPNSIAHGTKIKNNIFYSKYKTLAINVMDAESLVGFECDYNVYWVEEGDHTPVFNAGGSTKTWTEWRAMGYDAHSIVLNPNFIDFVSFVPAARLNYGTDLGTSFNTGLSTNATWTVGSMPATQVQNGTWQVGAIVYAPATPTYFLYLSKSALTIPATANSDGKFNIISNTTWNAVSSQPWLTVAVELYYSLGGQGYKTLPYSGSAPDIGAMEFMQTNASGHDSAFVTLTAEANTGAVRNATVTVSGTGVSSQNVVVTQEAAVAPPYDGPWYLSPSGNDALGNGSITSPWFTINKAWTVAKPGDTIYMRGGTYNYPSQQFLSGKNGTSGNYIKIWAYNNEIPIITRTTTWTHNPATNAGIYLSGDYTYWKGLTIKGFVQEDSGNWAGFWQQNSSHNIYEDLDYYNNGFSFLIGINITDSSNDILVVNCDFHHNYDPLTPSPYDNADGVSVNVGHGATVVFRGCRFWSNSDDGIDALESDGSLTLDQCWAWSNGYREDGITKGGNGHGFKLGQGTTQYLTEHLVTVTNCLAFHNRQGGFTVGQSTSICWAFNNTAYHNADDPTVYNLGFEFASTTAVHVLRNNIAYGNQHPSNLQANYSGCVEDHNSWDAGYTVTDADFVSLNMAGVDGPRKSDGSLPDITFLHLAQGSDLINTGVNVGIPYIGTNPDLGAFESNYSPVSPTQYYVGPSGSDITGNGTITNPWYNLTRAWTEVKAGDTIYMRGGSYNYTITQTLMNKSGTLTSPIRILAYQNEIPIVNGAPGFAYEQGILLEDCSYIHIKGLEIKDYVQPAPDKWGNGIYAMDVNNCVFENLNIHHGCFGMSLTNDDGTSNNNLIYNCDFHHNSDPITSFPPPYTDLFPYGNADGLTIRIDGALGLGTTNYVIGCRMWYNSDDGIDLWSNEGMVIIKDSWAFLNGYYNDTTNPNPGDGNGFKLGLSYIDNHGTVLRKVYNCIGYMNKSWGFVRNGAACNIEVFNNTAYSNGTAGNGGGFFFGNDGGPIGDIPFYVKNNIAYSNVNDYSFWSNELLQNVDHNTWNLPVTVTNADFVNLISSELRNPRQADGSLPNINFLHLVTGSDLIGKGIDVGIPYKGLNPDLGAFEFDEELPSIFQIIVSKGYRIKTGANVVTTSIQ